jgi:type II secretory pathway pseudopilin PulG
VFPFETKKQTKESGGEVVCYSTVKACLFPSERREPVYEIVVAKDFEKAQEQQQQQRNNNLAQEQARRQQDRLRTTDTMDTNNMTFNNNNNSSDTRNNRNRKKPDSDPPARQENRFLMGGSAMPTHTSLFNLFIIVFTLSYAQNYGRCLDKTK